MHFGTVVLITVEGLVPAFMCVSQQNASVLTV